LPQPIGIELLDGRFSTIVEKQTLLPFRRTFTVTTTSDNQTAISIRLFQGEHAQARRNEYLGTLTMANLEPRQAGEIEFEVTLGLSEDCLLRVSARHRGTGECRSSTLRTKELSVQLVSNRTLAERKDRNKEVRGPILSEVTPRTNVAAQSGTKVASLGC